MQANSTIMAFPGAGCGNYLTIAFYIVRRINIEMIKVIKNKNAKILLFDESFLFSFSQTINEFQSCLLRLQAENVP